MIVTLYKPQKHTNMAPKKTAASAATPYRSCTIKQLPQEHWEKAAATAAKINPANAPALHQLRQAFPKAAIKPAHLSVMTSKYWGAAGVSLTVSFLDNPPAALRKKIISHMNAWGVFSKVKFTEVTKEGQVRIARKEGDGYWSYLGTDILHIPKGQPTMNLDSFSMTTPDSEFFRVVRHETGHTLGFPHEHMRSDIVAGIDTEKAIQFFMKDQGWSRAEVIAQVLTPINNSALSFIDPADEHSIMCYALPAQIMKKGKPVPGGVDIDAKDKKFAASIYPKK